MSDEGQIQAELSEIEQLRNRVNELETTNQKHLKTIGDQGNQIGDLRQVVSQQIEQQTSHDDYDYFDDPHEKELRQIKSEVSQLRTQDALRQLEDDFPGFRELPNNTEFQDWVAESPTRADLYRRADSMDINAAREMLSLWHEREQMKADLQVQGKTQRREALNAATMEKGTAGGAKTTYWDRRDLQDMRTNPARADEWASKWPDIQKAYAEGRVR